MVIVKFLKPHGAYNAGESAGFGERLADEYVKLGIAEVVKSRADGPAKQQAAALAKPEADKAMKSPQRGK